MNQRVYILGGYQTDFAKNWTKKNQSIYEILAESVVGALEATEIEPHEVESAHIGNFVGERFCGQGQLGGMFVSIHPDFVGIPTSRHEAACASGSMAVLAAMTEIEANRYDLVCVSGVELMRNVSGTKAAEFLAAAAWNGKEALEATYLWPYQFSEIAQMYQERFGLNREHLAAIAKINFSNAQRNPNGQTRRWTLTEEHFGENDAFNPKIEGMLRKQDCGRITDGGATIFLASAKYAKAYAQKRNINFESLPYIKGWGHRTAPILLSEKFHLGANTEYPFPHLRQTILDAYRRANIQGAETLDAIETHDCFSISEYVALEHFGLSKAGEAWKLIEEDAIALSGRIPVNPSGGLIGTGHPVGATGVRMLLDASKQIRSQAGDYQVEGAQNIGVLNIGGSLTTVASFVIGQ